VRPGRKLPVGERIRFDEGLEGEIVARAGFGERNRPLSRRSGSLRRLDALDMSPAALHQAARIRPPIATATRPVFARRKEGSVACADCRASLHAEVLAAAAQRAPNRLLSLHVGLGTFKPLHEKWSNRRR